MRVVDCHVHIRDQVDSKQLLKQLDEAGVDRAIVFSLYERSSLEKAREKLLAAKPLLDIAPDRISGLAWVNPVIEGIGDLACEAMDSMGYIGIKLIPDHWYPYEDRVAPFWDRMNERKASILIHTGILYGWGDASQYCRPLHLEKLVEWPDLRFAMAHISWPWCEECLAVMGRFRAESRGGKRPWQSYVDLTPGTPPHIRKQAVGNAISFCGAEHIMFGTDAGAPQNMAKQKEIIQRDLAMFQEFGLADDQIQRIMAGTADEVFPARK